MKQQDFKTENTSDIYMQKLVRPETSGPTRQHAKVLQRQSSQAAVAGSGSRMG